MKPEQQAREYAEAQIVDVHDDTIQMERQDWIDNTADDWLAGHAAGVQAEINTQNIAKEQFFDAGWKQGVQAERERIWVEFKTLYMSSKKTALIDYERIIFGEQP